MSATANRNTGQYGSNNRSANGQAQSNDYIRNVRTIVKAKFDPLWFVSDVLGIKLFESQAQIMREFYRNRYDNTLAQYKKLVILAGMRCVVGNTNIHTHLGLIPIKILVPDNAIENVMYKPLHNVMVQNKLGYVNVEAVAYTGIHDIITIKLTNEMQISGAPGHRHLVMNDVSNNDCNNDEDCHWKWCKLEDIEIGDRIWTIEGSMEVIYKTFDEPQMTYDLLVPRGHSYYSNGILSHNSGKTALASIMGAYELFDVITLDNPAAHYGLLKNQPIFLTTVATSSQLASDGVFANMCNFIEGSEWFQSWADLKINNDRIECPSKHVVSQVLSSWATTAVGRSNRCVIFDELDLFEDTSGKRGAWEIWSRLRKSTDTFGADGHVIAISSPKSATGIMMNLYKQGLADTTSTLAIMKPTWEMNPNLTKIDLMEEYKYDMPTFWRDFACQPEVAGGLEFPEGVRLIDMPNVLTCTSMPHNLRPISRVMAIDPAVKNDAFGVACGYLTPDGHIIVDGVTKFTKIEGDAYIKPSDVEKFIYDKIPKLNINNFVYDVWMFPNIIEDLDVRFGIHAVKHIVQKEDYDRWRGLQTNPQDISLTVVYDEDLKRETDNLQITRTAGGKPKVDHPYAGSRDISDCVANIIWYLSTNGGEDKQPERPSVVSVIAF